MTETRWLDAREAHLWQSYRDAFRELTTTLEGRLIRNSGLSGADYALLHPLEKRGLVVREECVADARGSMVRLTDAGRAAIEAAAPDHVDAVRTHFLEQLTREEQDLLTKLLDRVLADLPTRGDDTPTAIC